MAGEQENAVAARQPFIYIALDKDRAVTRDLFLTERYPETILIDPQQRMAGKIVGATRWPMTGIGDQNPDPRSP